MKGASKKVVSLFLVFAMLFSILPTGYAYDGDVIPADAFRVSDEYAATHPNGVIDFATVHLETIEGADDFDVIIVRRGGTEGRVTVDFKIIELTATYGADFTVQVPSFFGWKTLKKDCDTPTLMEAQLQESGVSVITAEEEEEILPVSWDDEGTDTGADAAEIEEYPEADTETSEEVTLMEEHYLEENEEEHTEKPVPGNSPDYKSSLHAMRDEVFGTTTSHEIKEFDNASLFEVQNEEENAIAEAIHENMPGVSDTLTFRDGENHKRIRVSIVDDDIYEGPEQFIVGLYNPTGGAQLGNSINATVNIKDNDPVVPQEISFEHDYYSVSPAEGSVSININRSGGIYNYADIELSTISGTAKAHTHYRPVTTTALFMPGETVKTVEIPLLEARIDEPLNFELILTDKSDNNSTIQRANIEIQPAPSTSASAEIAENDNFYEEKYINIRGFGNVKVTKDDSGYKFSYLPSFVEVEKNPDQSTFFDADCDHHGYHVVVPLRSGWTRYSSVTPSGNFEWAGIEKFSVFLRKCGPDIEARAVKAKAYISLYGGGYYVMIINVIV